MIKVARNSPGTEGAYKERLPRDDEGSLPHREDRKSGSPFGMSGVGEITTQAGPGLPRAIEGLPCEQRILWATVRLVAEKGFESVTVFDVIDRADVSRAGFYELFESKDECLFAAYEKVLDVAVAYVARAFEGGGLWPLRMRRAMEACLGAGSAEPDIARRAAVSV